MADLFDSRLYRVLSIGANQKNGNLIVPGTSNAGGYFYDYYESPQAAAQAADERPSGNPDEDAALRSKSQERAQGIESMQSKYTSQMTAPYSFVHPYALLKLAGAYGDISTTNQGTLIDKAGRRKFYEIDGDQRGGYAKSPTTTAIINWGGQDPRGRFPYSFADFVYCKYWNKIQNNRMITLRRYPMPVPDSVEPANYKPQPADAERSINKPVESVNEPFAPLATAVTYFGEETGNSLKDILKFTVGYEWEELEADLWNTSSTQNESGSGVMGPGAGFLGTGLGQVVQGLGILDDLMGKHEIIPTDAVGIGPDPYSTGPYENRIIGPINVVKNVYKRKRGLKFTQDGLNITFEYVSRPIAGVNNKAIMLDLMSNLLVMTSASGTFFGGAHRYRTENPAVYPSRDLYSLTQLYRGKIFGKSGAPAALMQNAFNGERINFMTNFASEMLNDIKGIASALLSKITGMGDTDATQEKQDIKAKADAIKSTAGRVVAAHLLKGASIPWLTGARAILTGDPVGDWHLTIGNPLNPISMIGNLIVDSCDFEFSDELGPDDFPISMKAIVHLKHGMPRDRDAVTSMFNRGFGRTYSLPDSFVSSADRGTKVDEYTDPNSYDNNKIQMKTMLAPSGRDYISKIGNFELFNKGTAYSGELKNYSLTLNSTDFQAGYPTYMAMPWQTRWTL